MEGCTKAMAGEAEANETAHKGRKGNRSSSRTAAGLRIIESEMVNGGRQISIHTAIQP